MKRLLCTLLLCLSFGPGAWALDVVGTFPPANSENFVTGDTLRVWFDAVPGATVAVSIQGANAGYPVGWRGVHGDTLLVVPQHYWMVGERVTVSVFGTNVIHPYTFTFSVAVPMATSLSSPNTRNLQYGYYPRSMAASDFDGDGLVDLAILFTDRLGVVRNSGVAPYFDGTTLTWTDGGHAACDAPRILRAADLNGDGLPDLVASDPIRNTLRIYPNTSGGGVLQFGAPIVLTFQMVGPSDFKLADMNADGLPDIVAIGRLFDPDFSRMAVRRNHGSFLFDNASEESNWYIGLDPSMLDIADFDQDGKLDVIVSCRGDKTVQLLRNWSINPLNFNVQTAIDSLPAGPDGVIADNLYPCWNSPDDRQRPDIVVWSRGVHSIAPHGGRNVLDDEPFINRYCGNGGASFSEPNSVTIPGYPLQITLGSFDNLYDFPDKDWIIIRQDPAVGLVAQAYDDQLNPLEQIGSLQNPVSSLMFDLDLDGDLDLFFMDNGDNSVGDEKIVYLYTPVTVEHPTVDFGLTPITGATRTFGYSYVNMRPYPEIITGVDIPFPDSVFSFISPAFPDTLLPGTSVGLTFGFTPRDSIFYGPQEAQIFFAGGSGASGDTLMLTGVGGRSVLETVPPSGQAHSFDIDFGTLEPTGITTVTFPLANSGNYPLHVAYNTALLDRFSLIGPPVDSVQAHSVSTTTTAVRFTAPSVEGSVRECITIYDSTFYQSDWFGPRNRLVRDTVSCCFRARVIRNSLPQFVFPNISPFEGDRDTVRIRISDPNSLPGQDSVRVQYLGVTPERSHFVTDPATFAEGWVGGAFDLIYHVNHGLPLSGENCTLFFRAWDFQFPGRTIDTSWSVHVNDVDDAPVCIPGDTTINVNEGEFVSASVRVWDEENEAFDVYSVGRPASAQDTFGVVPGLYSLTWRPDFDAAGTYVVQVIAHERDHPWLGDTARVVIIVHDRFPNLQVTDLRSTPASVERNNPVLISYSFREQLGVPVPTPFTVILKDSMPGAVRILLSRDYESLAAGAVVTESYTYFLNVCGAHIVSVQVICWGPDLDSTDNWRAVSIPVRCPDLAAGNIVVPPRVHKNDDMPIEVTVEERNGVSMDTTFIAVLKVHAAGLTRTVAALPFHGLGAHASATQSFSWAPDTCNTHEFELQVVAPPGWDANPANDITRRSMEVECEPFHVYPLPFTPNGDGYNDTLHFAFGDNTYKWPVVTIFSLDGRLVSTERSFRSNSIVWLGRDRYGKECPPGAYLYTFQNGDKKITSGIIYVAR
ncbi:MAG TPA: FG-GAP-like repeat-containing protein [bacterium]|jgi:hypothetical protein